MTALGAAYRARRLKAGGLLQPVAYYNWQWRLNDIWAHVPIRLLDLARLHSGRDLTPTAALIYLVGLRLLFTRLTPC